MLSALKAAFRLPARFELPAALVIFLLFTLLNLAVATRTPTVGHDEPGYADPAINLYLGSGFTSTMWAQPRHDFWLGNVPLYQGILYCFFKCIGFGLLQTRMVNSVLAAVAAGLVWQALRWNRLVRTPFLRLLALALMLSGSVSSLTFRTIRPDTTMFLVCAAIYCALNLPAKPACRWCCAAAAAALAPAAGLPLIPYLGFVGCLSLVFFGWRVLGPIIAVGAGLAAGIGLLVVFYNHFSSWSAFAGIVLPYTGLAKSVSGDASYVTLMDRIRGTYPGDENLLVSFFGDPRNLLDPKTMFDYSAAILFLCLLFLAWRTWPKLDAKTRRAIGFIVVMTVLTPPLMFIAGHYRSFYRWMTYIPLGLALPWLWQQTATDDQPVPPHAPLISLLLGVSLAMGIPLRTLAVLPGWNRRSMQPLEQAAAEVLKPTDVVVCGFKGYYAIRPRARLVYGVGQPSRGELKRAVDLPADEVTVLCVTPKDLALAIDKIGGQWKKIELPPAAAQRLAQTEYAADFYRRDKN